MTVIVQELKALKKDGFTEMTQIDIIPPGYLVHTPIPNVTGEFVDGY